MKLSVILPKKNMSVDHQRAKTFQTNFVIEDFNDAHDQNEIYNKIVFLTLEIADLKANLGQQLQFKGLWKKFVNTRNNFPTMLELRKRHKKLKLLSQKLGLRS